MPNDVGEWKIKVNDGTGHGVVTKVIVKEEMKVNTLQHEFPRWQKLIIVVSIIFLQFSLIYYFKARKIKDQLNITPREKPKKLGSNTVYYRVEERTLILLNPK